MSADRRRWILGASVSLWFALFAGCISGDLVLVKVDHRRDAGATQEAVLPGESPADAGALPDRGPDLLIEVPDGSLPDSLD